MRGMILILLLMIQVGALAQLTRHFTIQGGLVNFDANRVFLAYRGPNGPVWDSAEVKDRVYTFEGVVKDPNTMGRLFILYKDAETGAAKSHEASLFLDTCTFIVDHMDSLSNMVFVGSTMNIEYRKLQMAAQPFAAKIDSVKGVYKSARKKGDLEGMATAQKTIQATIQEENEQVYARYVMAYPSSPVAYYAVAHYDTDDSVGYVRMRELYVLLPEPVRASVWGKEFSEGIAKASELAIGTQAKDFVQNDTLGHPVRLSSYRGKYVLLDFWASWCHPCRLQNPYLVEAYRKYHAKGLDILGVSMDKSDAREQWLKAIQEDHVPWQQVSDLLGGNNAAARLYQIQFIPRNFLIDPKGKIIAKDLEGEDLGAQLSLIFRN